MIRNFAKFSCVLNIVEVSISSLSEFDRSEFGRLCVSVAMIADLMFQQLCASRALEPYKGTLYRNGSPISNANATLLSYSSFTIPTYLKTTYDLRLANIKSSSRLEKKNNIFQSSPPRKFSPSQKQSAKYTEILAQRLTLATAFWDIDKS